MSLVDEKNSAFWNELCGSTLARSLGVTDDTAPSLKRFDDWYMDLYPYLKAHIPFEQVRGKQVLEIGLGYGTVAQQLIEAGADYHGLDIAAGPVGMARHRAALLGVKVDVRQGSALENPHASESMDFVISIGCLHHTGNLAQALREVHRVLKVGGQASLMVYSALSYRQWQRSPFATFGRSRAPSFDWSNADANLRRAYDANLDGAGAPETAYVTRQEAFDFLRPLFREVRVRLRNIGTDFLPSRLTGRNLGNALFESWLGLDLYIECVK